MDNGNVKECEILKKCEIVNMVMRIKLKKCEIITQNVNIILCNNVLHHFVYSRLTQKKTKQIKIKKKYEK